MTTVLAELGFGGVDSRPNFAESITDGVLVPDGRWLRYQQKAWPAFSSSGNGTATGQTFPVANTDLFLVRTQVMYFRTPAWSRAFHSTATPSWHRHVRLSTEITMQESFPNFSGGTSYGEDDVTVGLIYAGESSGKGFAWVYQRLSDGATTRIAHGYFTATGNAGTFNQLGPAVTVAAFTASSTETLEVEMRLDASGGIITHTCFFRGVAVATFTLNSALYNAYMNTSISTNLVNRTFYQGAVARYPGGFGQAAFDTSVIVVSGLISTITSPDITGYSIRQYQSGNPAGILTAYFATATRHMLFDNVRLVDLNPALVTPPVDTMPVLVPSFVTGAGISVSSEDDGGSATISLAPDYSQPIEDQYGVSEIKYDSGHTYTRAVYTRRRRAWSLHWEALSPADKSTLETHVTNVKTRFAVFNWVDPETNVTERVRFVSDMRFDRVSFAVWRASAVVEEVLT